MRGFRYPNKISRNGSDGKQITVTHDVFALLDDNSSDGVAFVVGARLTHQLNQSKDLFQLGEEVATKLGIPDKALYRIRKTTPILVSNGRITEMTKEQRGFVVGFDKKVSEFKADLEEYFQDVENQLKDDNLIIPLVPSLGIALQLSPGRGFGDQSRKVISDVFARPGTVTIPFQSNGETQHRPIDFDRGLKKLCELLQNDSVGAAIVKKSQ